MKHSESQRETNNNQTSALLKRKLNWRNTVVTQHTIAFHIEHKP